MVFYTKKKIISLDLSNTIEVEVGNAEFLSYPDESFDACVSLRLFGHTPQEIRIKILKELKRVVKKYLILVYYHKNCLQYFIRAQKRRRKKLEWHPVTYKQIEEELKITGLKKVKILSSGKKDF